MSRLTLNASLRLYKEYMKGRGCGSSTLRTKSSYLDVFGRWLEERSVEDLREISRNDLVDFTGWLNEAAGRRTGKVYRERTKVSILTAVRQLFLCLYDNEKILTNPAENFNRPGYEKSARMVLGEEEIGMFLDSIEPAAFLGLRDRALFELIYSSGLRAGEVSRLNVEDFDVESRLLWVRQSKFSKDRRVPVTRTACYFLGKYLEGVKRGDRALFLSQTGRLGPGGINKRFKVLLKNSGLYREGLSVHSLRHGCATVLLAHGAEIRYVQELLGHESVQTTVGYSRQSNENIKASYHRYHPRENAWFREPDSRYLEEVGKLVSDSLKQEERNRRARLRKEKTDSR